MWVQGPKALGRPLLLSQATNRELDGKWNNQAQIWVAGAVDGDLAYYTMVLAPSFFLINHDVQKQSEIDRAAIH